MCCNPKTLALRNSNARQAAADVIGGTTGFGINTVTSTYNSGAGMFNYLDGSERLPYAWEYTPETGGQAAFYYGATGLTLAQGGVSAFRGIRSFFSSTESVIQFEQYSLRAMENGFYPVMKRGFEKSVGQVFLKEGEIWKYGQTMNPATRYSQTFLRNTGKGLEFYPEFKTPSFK